MDRILKLIIRGYRGLNWATKNVCPHSNYRVPVKVNLFWKICLCNIKWRISRWDPPGLIKWILDPWANVSTGREEETDRREDHVKLGAEAGVMEPQSNREARKGFLSGFTGTRKLFFFFLYSRSLLVIYFIIIFSFIFISWGLITLQYCSGFCHTLTWISHGFTCVPHPNSPSHLPPHPILLGLPSVPVLSTCLMHPTWAGDLFHPW